VLMAKPPKIRNGGTWTEAGFWGRVRSHLRRMFRFNWVPARLALERARRPYVGENKRQKWEFQCAFCHKWFLRKGVELDHIRPCGSLNSWEDVRPFMERLLCESPDDYAVLCKSCHKEKTDEERGIG